MPFALPIRSFQSPFIQDYSILWYGEKELRLAQDKYGRPSQKGGFIFELLLFQHLIT